MDVICLEDEALYKLIISVHNRIKKENDIKRTQWIPEDEAMDILKITSKATLQKYRDEGRIRFSQLDKKTILYDIDSIYELIEKHAK